MANKFGGFGGGANMQNLMRQAQAMQQKLAEAQQKLAEAEVTGTSGGGAVSVTMSGKKEVRGVTLDASVVDPEDVEMLEDLIVAALNDATAKADKLQ